MKKLFTCPVCGGNLNINPDSGIAVCESCGALTDADPAELQKLRAVHKEAQRAMRQSTAAGYAEAVRLLESISSVADVRELLAECRARQQETLQKQARQRSLAQDPGKGDAVLGILLIVLAALLVGAAAAGVIVLCVRWSSGELSPSAAAITVCAVLAVAALLFIGKNKSSR